MNKPTDEELFALCESRVYVPDMRALRDAGIAHGWREAIEALRERCARDPHLEYLDQAADDLERIAKERGVL